ncbi:MAG TPA: DUF1990 domain-containing protein [Acidobacteriaceae bacterium]
MFFLTRPTAQRIDRFRQMAKHESFSYPEVGATLGEALPARYNVDHNRIRLGEGLPLFEHAYIALQAWRMFELGWVELIHAPEAITPGQTVLVLAHTLGLYSLSASRVISMIDEDNGLMRRRGFSYGTLQHHVERGEERFSVEYHYGDDSVWYDILAFSVPQHPLARLGYPLSRAAQRRFAADSKSAMVMAVS